MDTIITVVGIGLLIGMVVLMFGYAGFIHQGPPKSPKDKTQEEDRADPPTRGDEE
ncbi:MAG: hypothetical protein IH886_09990 [Nitrospinae bacterium]|nr:hypothetical protein [Nitrospinota bacterium]